MQGATTIRQSKNLLKQKFAKAKIRESGNSPKGKFAKAKMH